MSGVGTNRYKSLLQLTESQISALEIIESGGTHEDAASAAGVHRVTVTKWCHHHPAFIAERNRRQIERAEQVSVLTDTLTIRAIEVVTAAIETGDESIAMQWLRLIGSQTGSPSERRNDKSRPVTARKVIDAVAEKESLMSPMAVLTDSYRDSAITSIATDLVE
jgi:hypothetical protein